MIIDPKNSPTHIIITVTARDILKCEVQSSSTWAAWYNYFAGTSDFSPVNVVQLVSMLRLETCDRLGKQQKISEDKAKGRVIILVNHVDMLPKPFEMKQIIMKNLKAYGVPENQILFGEKACKWDFEKLDAHDAKVTAFLNGIPKGEDYFEVMKKDGLASDYLQYSSNVTCTNTACLHNFTETTITAYRDYLRRILAL